MKNTLSVRSLSTKANSFNVVKNALFLVLACIMTSLPLVTHAQISGLSSVCLGSNITLTDPLSGSTWSSSNGAIATVGASTGVVHGVSAGTVYIYCSNGTTTDSVSITVNPVPAPITGPTIIYGPPLYIYGGMGTLADATPGGTWTSSNTLVASIAVTGVATGVACGNPIFTYTLPTGCFASQLDTVVCGPGTPWFYYSITGGSTPVCVGASVTLADTAAGGHWVSSNTSIAVIGSATGVLTGISAGTCNILYVLGSSYASTTITVSPTPAPISGPGIGLCVGSTLTYVDTTPGGHWSSSNPAIATIATFSGILTVVVPGCVTLTYTVGSCFSSTSYLCFTDLPIPPSIPYSLCIGASYTCSSGTSGGSWSSSNPAVGTIGPLSGVLSGISSGVTTISYTLPTGCARTQTVTINPLPSPITGFKRICYPFGATTLHDSASGGIWSSNNTGIAFIGSVSGIVTPDTAIGLDTITYTLSTGCFTTTTVSVMPPPISPGVIFGPNSVCAGSCVTETDLIGGGVWGISSPPIATISATGIVCGLSSGIATISITGTCPATKTITIIPAIAPITGSSTVCTGSSITLSNIAPGGTWTSSNSSVATVGSLSGIVSGIGSGTATITYTISSTGCYSIRTITVSPIPAAYGISGGGAICAGSSGVHIGLVNSVSGINYQLLNGLTPVITLAGTGSALDYGPQSVAGTYTVVATNPVTTCSVTMSGSASITVNPVPAPISGPTAVCVGSSGSLTSSPGAGTWSSSNIAVASIGTSGVVNALSSGTTNITYTLPGTGCYTTKTVTATSAPCPLPAIPPVCVGIPTTITDCIPGGVWTSSTLFIAGIGYLSGTITGVTPGIDTITYSLGTGCIVTTTVSVISAPAIITGPSFACTGSTITLSDITPSGTWTSSATATAIISGSGIVTGVTAGTTTISYTVSGCTATKIITVNPTPSPIGGPATLCQSATATQTNSVPGGTWSITPAGIASIDSVTGLVTGLTPGSATVSYAIGSCIATRIITVNATAVISGSSGICVGSANTLSASIPGGNWTSATTSVATVVSGTGVVSGITTGTSVISYTLPTGCLTTSTVTVSTSPGPISGPATICNGSCNIFSPGVGGGTWSSSSLSVATINPLTGNLCALSPGIDTITYTLGGGCIISTVSTVLASPSAIGGSTSVCAGQLTTLTNSISGGTWSSSSPATATVDAISGTVTGIHSGTAIITYTLGSGCSAIRPLVVNPFSPIYGPSSVCTGQSIVLNDTTLGGTWSSTLPSVATVNPTGLVTGLSAGTAIIDYTLPTGCTASATITVNSILLPIAGPHTVCTGATISLTDPVPGGAWYSSNNTLATVSTSGLVSGLTPGVDTINYSISGGCPARISLTINPLPAAISGSGVVCLGTTTALTNSSPGGMWSSSAPATASIGTASGIVSAITPGVAVITYTLPTSCYITTTVTVIPTPAPVSGTTLLCTGNLVTYSDVTPGGVWNSSNSAIVTIDPVTGAANAIAPGNATISYNIGVGCLSGIVATVNPLPAAISGSTLVCQAGHITLSDATPLGTWSSSNLALATVGATTGIVSGIAPGLVTIAYSLPTGCFVSSTIFVNPSPSPITGVLSTCIGLTTPLSDATPGGTWSSGNPATASVGTSGSVTGAAAGSAIISYTAPTGCSVFTTVTIYPTPTIISGSPTICAGASNVYTDGVSGGTWSSANTAVASATTTSGIVTGVSAGITNISYTLGYSCWVTKAITVNPLPAIISGPSAICAGSGATFADATPGGTWSSSNPSIAIAGSGSGLVLGVSAGTTLISYSLGCTTVHLLTVNPMPAAIGGSFNTCIVGTTTLTNSITGGTWTSATTSVATVDAISGVVTGIAPGAATINYTLGGGCYTSAVVNIYPAPLAFSITGGGNYCAGGTGMSIGLSGSESGVNYLLYRGTTATGTFPGSGAALDFGLQTVSGFYSVVGTATSSGCTINMTGSASIGILPTVTPTVNINATPGDSVCSGTMVTFVAASTFGGPAPLYTWYVNGISIGSGPTYTYIPLAGDIIKVKLTSSATCPLPDTVFSSDTMTIHLSSTPAISITASPSDTICKGSVLSVHASSSFGGTSPVYTWVKNGSIVSSATLYSFIPNDNDNIYCILQSNYPCRTKDFDTSNTVIIKVDTPVTPVVTIYASPGAIVNQGDTVTLSAIVAYGGSSPTYQWYYNGIPISGATNSVYRIDTFSTPQLDSFTCKVTGSAPCHVIANQGILIKVAPVGIKHLSSLFTDITLAPNPAKNQFRVYGTLGSCAYSTGADNAQLEISNMMGQVVYKKAVTVNAGRLNENIRLNTNIPNGVYILTVQTDGEQKIIHFVIEQ